MAIQRNNVGTKLLASARSSSLPKSSKKQQPSPRATNVLRSKSIDELLEDVGTIPNSPRVSRCKIKEEAYPVQSFRSSGNLERGRPRRHKEAHRPPSKWKLYFMTWFSTFSSFAIAQDNLTELISMNGVLERWTALWYST